MSIIKIATKNLLQRKMRTVCTMFGISVGIAGFVVLVGLGTGFENALEKTFNDRGTDLIVFEEGKPQILTSVIDENIIDEMKAMPGIKQVAGIMLDLIRINKRHIVVYGWRKDSFLFNKSNIVKGRSFENDVNEALLGDLCAKTLAKEIGDYVQIGRTKFEIVGIYTSGSIFERGSVIVPLKKFQKVKKRSGEVTMINIQTMQRVNGIVDAKDVVDMVKQEIEVAYPGLEVEKGSDFLSGEGEAVSVTKGLTWAVSLVALFIVIVGTMNVMMMSVFEKTREIGVLVAIGWNKYKLFQLVIFESLCLSIFGSVFGVCLGYVVLHFLAEAPKFQGLIEGSYNVITIVQIFVVVVGVGVFSALYPALKVMSFSVVEALRYE